MIETGFYGMFTPRLVSRIGYCDFSCTRCGTICPTGAIQKLSLAKKQTFVIGTAYIIKDLCIPWSESTNCIVCEEVCPVQNKAITLDRKVITNKKGEAVEVLLPVVHTAVYRCGICETAACFRRRCYNGAKTKRTMGDSYG
jgi:formate hydrogenlyase subunit 6/NADH:ubiquinone oxidoreductase subunit I